MKPIALVATAFALLGLCACQPDPADAPPVGAAPTAAAATPRPEPVSEAARQADFRLALFDARSRLQDAWRACGDADAGCRERALATYDTTLAEASRQHGVAIDEVVQLQPPAAATNASAPLVQLTGSRG